MALLVRDLGCRDQISIRTLVEVRLRILLRTKENMLMGTPSNAMKWVRKYGNKNSTYLLSFLFKN
jgi:hypothetical protein